MRPLLLLLLVLVGGAPQRAPELQLNLVAAPPPPPPRPAEMGPGEGCGNGTGPGDHSTTTPFTVTLADTDRLAYTVGDTLVFNVIIENTSMAPLVLGISRDPHIAPRTMRPCRIVPSGVHFSVALVVMRKAALGASVAVAAGYYGSPDVPGTTLVLQPGERVRVQLPAQVWPGLGMEPVLTTDPQSVRIKALVMIEGESLRAVYSDNALAIELSEPIRRH